MCKSDSKLTDLELDVFSNALDSLDMAVKFLLEFEEAFKWKWIVIASTDALYGFMIAALTGSDRARVVEYKKQFNDFKESLQKSKEFKKFKSSLEENYKGSIDERVTKDTIAHIENREIVNKFLWSGKAKLISFREALKRIEEEAYMKQYGFSKKLTLTGSERKDILMIRDSFRNQFIHFTPGVWIISPQVILKPLQSVTLVLERLLDCGNLYLYDNRKRAKELARIFKDELLRLDTSVSKS